MCLQIFVPTNQEHTIRSISCLNRSVGVLLLGGNENLQAHDPLWNSLDMPVTEDQTFKDCCQSVVPSVLVELELFLLVSTSED